MKKNSNNNYLKYFLIIICTIIVVLFCYSILYKNDNKVIFNINEKSIKLKIGEQKKISYELSDSNLSIDWQSSNNNIVIVTNNGELIANDYGEVLITGTIKDNGKAIVDNCVVNTYTGDIDIPIEDVIVPTGYLLMLPNSEYDIPFTITPNDAYTTAVNYFSSDETVAIIKNNKVVSLNEGLTTITLDLNDEITVSYNVRVSNETKENRIVEGIDSVSFDEENIIMEYGDIRSLSYNFYPKESSIKSIDWISSNSKIVTVDDGIVKAMNIGEAEIKVVVNGNIEAKVNVKVQASNANIMIDYYPKSVIKVGEMTSVKYHLYPIEIKDDVKYESSNPSVARIDNGIITGVNSGNAVITLSISNGKSKSFVVNVLPKTGGINGSANFWGYKSLNAKTPLYADKTFFQNLAQKGFGLIQGDNYIISSSGQTYNYNISSNVLSVSSKKIQVRIYYPPEVDLSTTNTLVFMGGRGETNFYGAFKDIKDNPSIVKSGGILALVAEGKNFSFDGDSGAYVTKFLKSITNQKPGVKNSILGFSDGAHQVMQAAKTMVYDKMIVFSGYADWVDTLENAKNSEVIIMIANSDGNYSQAKTALRNMIKSGYKNLTIVSTGKDLSSFEKNVLVINPGTLMRNGHFTINVLNSKIIEYAND